MAATDWVAIFTSRDGLTSFDCHRADATVFIDRDAGVDITPVSLATMKRGNRRTVGQPLVAVTPENGSIGFTMHLQSAAASALLDNLTDLENLVSQETDFYFKPPSATSGLTYKAMPFVPSLKLDDKTWAEAKKVSNIGVSFEIEPYGLGSIGSLALAASGTTNPLQVGVTGLAMDVDSPARYIWQHNGLLNGSVVANRFIIGRRASYSSGFVGIATSGSAVPAASGVWTDVDTCVITQPLAACRGTYRVIAEVSSTATGTPAYQVRARVSCGATSYTGTVSNAKSAPTANNILDLGQVTIPPLSTPDTATGNATVRVQMYQSTAASTVMAVTWLALVPTDGGICYQGSSVAASASTYGIGVDGTSATRAVYEMTAGNNFTTPTSLIVPKPSCLWEIGRDNNIVAILWYAGTAAQDDQSSYLTAKFSLHYAYQPRYHHAR